MPTHINCNDIIDFTFQIGRWFIIAALFAAVAMAVAEAIAKFRQRKSERTTDERRGVVAESINALKDLLIALGNLPAWFAIFLAGAALIWFARDTISLCH
jgi:hypothetical protein